MGTEEMGTFLVSDVAISVPDTPNMQKGTHLFEVRPLLLGNEECPRFLSPHYACLNMMGMPDGVVYAFASVNGRWRPSAARSATAAITSSSGPGRPSA